MPTPVLQMACWQARALKSGPRPSELFVDAGAGVQRRRKGPFPTENAEYLSKDRFAAGCDDASRSNRFLLALNPPGKASHFSALLKALVGARIACRSLEFIALIPVAAVGAHTMAGIKTLFINA